MAQKYDFKGIRNKRLKSPFDIAFGEKNWATFEKKGDAYAGFIADVTYRPADGVYKASRCITLKTEDGKYLNVAIKRLPFVLKETNNLRLGDPLEIVYEETMKAKQKGFKDAKILAFYGENLPENAGNMTVFELDERSRVTQGQKADPSEEAADAAFDEMGSDTGTAATEGKPF